jgi:hypothetical protein
MAVDEQYIGRLHEWLMAERLQFPSWAAFAAYLTSLVPGQSITDATLTNWRDGKFSKPLDYSRLAMIAAYKKTTPDVIQAWLEGRLTEEGSVIIQPEAGGSTPSPFVRSIARRLKQASLAEISAVLDLASQRLHQIQSEDTNMDAGEAGTEQGSLIAMAVSSMLLIADIDPEEFGRRIGVTEEELSLVLSTDAPIPRALINRIGDGLRTLGPIWTDRALISLERSRVADCEFDPQHQQEFL